MAMGGLLLFALSLSSSSFFSRSWWLGRPGGAGMRTPMCAAIRAEAAEEEGGSCYQGVGQCLVWFLVGIFLHGITCDFFLFQDKFQSHSVHGLN